MPFPELVAGGFTRADGTVEFYCRVQALLEGMPQPCVVMDFGAGRGLGAQDAVPFRRRLRELRGPGRTVIGVDVDPAVRTNPCLDEARVIDPATGEIPLAGASVDLVVSDFTFEHIDDPIGMASEFDRVLKPGGWVCARTPNRWGYIALGARAVPNRLHIAALRRLQPHKAAEDTFPTRYRLNTRRALERAFPAPHYSVFAYTTDAEPELYAGGSKALARALAAAHLLPGPAKSLWMVFIRKTG